MSSDSDRRDDDGTGNAHESGPMTDDRDPDDAMISELRGLVAEVDPVPSLVSAAAKAALGWRRLDADLAELLSDSALDTQGLALARGAGAPVRSVGFSTGALTIDVDVHVDADRRTLLGQLSPPAAVTIEVQRADDDETARTETDALGRFRVTVAAGRPVRLRVLTPRDGPAVETSWVSI
jgi:hypothetical protein